MPKQDDIENLPAPTAPSGGGNQWLPVLILLILTPLLTYLTINFLVMPRLLEAIREAGVAAAAAGGGEHGETGGGAHGAAGAGGHGGDAATGEIHTYEITNVVANLSGALRSRYVKVSFTLEGSDPNFATIIQHNEARIRDATLGILSELSLSDLEEPGIKNVVRNDLLTEYITTLGGQIVNQLYFSEFVVQ